MNNNTFLQKSDNILYLVNTDYNKFANEYSQYIVTCGEREFDGALYGINLSNKYILVIETKAYEVVDFEIRSKTMTKKLSKNDILNMWYPV